MTERTFDPLIWFQVSARHRLVARLPEGKSGIEALLIAEPSRPMWVLNMGERAAGDQYLRVYCKDVETISEGEWAAFKAAGGTVYAGQAGRFLIAKIMDDV